MKNSFTQAMAWLHTWAGLLISWLLFVIFVGGTIACFDKELNTWMRPGLSQVSTATVDYDATVAQLRRIAPDAQAWYVTAPTARDRATTVRWFPGDGGIGKIALDPATGAKLADTHGGEFFFTLHYNLHAGTIGMYIVGLAGMMLLVAIVTGVIIHRRIFKDFFTFRPRAGGQRAWLDGHNLTGVLGLPFHLMIAYTGVAIFVISYMSAGVKVAYRGDMQKFYNEAGDYYSRPELQRPLSRLHSIDALLPQAQAYFGHAPAWVGVQHPNDAGATIAFGSNHSRRIAWSLRQIHFDGGSGELLHAARSPGAGYQTYSFLGGLHMVQFGGPAFRWLYFLMGLSGCVMIATGLQVWLEKRARRVAEAGAVSGYGLVRALNLGVVGGLPLACTAMLWANRVLPVDLAQRARAEVLAFVAVWILAALWGLWRLRAQRRGWRELFAATATLLLGLPLLNLLATPQAALPATLAQGDWTRAAVDLTAFALGAGFAALAWRCGMRIAPARAPRQALRVAGGAR